MSEIDWREIRERLERSNAASARWGERDSEHTRAILKARAQALAVEADDHAEQMVDVVEFLLAYERYALELDHIREIHAMKDVTPVPGAPPFVVGIINVRGQIVSVIDLKKFFDLPAKGLPDLNRVIIIGNGVMEFGLLADSVTGVRQLSLAAIQPALPTLSGVRAEYLKGVTSDRLALLDAGRLLEDPKINVCQSAEV